MCAGLGGYRMAGRRSKIISVRTSEPEFVAIADLASQRQIPVSDFVRSAALEATSVRPLFSENDRLILLHLRDELKNEGLNLTSILIALNRNCASADASIRAEMLAMQRTITALCVELLGYAKAPVKFSNRGHDA
jgi:hypothetical protein